VRAEGGSTSRSRLRLRLPEGWSAVTPYPPGTGGTSRIEHPERRFDRPTGWFVLGDIAALHEDIAGTHVAIAGPSGHNVRRHDLLAMMRWHLPTLNQLLGKPLERFLIVSAGDPMWRGGLSASSSVFLHANRPLISEDGTSPLLHELMHAALRVQSQHGADWIVEGLAELYSLELLRRAGTFDDERFQRSLERLERRGGSIPERGSSSTGATSARAATVLHALDLEIRERTGEAKSLDHVVRALAGRRSSITTDDFRTLAEQVTGLDLGRFFRRHLRR
jgi:predicted metalloprotease with PDZ domain